MRRLVPLFAAFALAGCNLMGIGDLEVASCEVDEDCDAFNRQLGDEPCERYRCDAVIGTCVSSPIDDDGDGETPTRCGGTDCDDGDRTIAAGSDEVCGNLVDEDCSGAANDLDCDGEDAVEIGGTDCDDGDPAIASDAEEVCGNLVDEDCSGVANDLDCDGEDSVDVGGTDCDDGDPGVYADAEEVCGNLVDEDCSGVANDLDCDGEDSVDVGGTDCDDGDPGVYAAAEEVCGNLIDEDCSGMANDMDCDGLDSIELGGTDCNDADASIGPHVAEVCNGVDDDCNGLLDGPDEDDDLDGHADSCAGGWTTDCDDASPTTYFDAEEICDGLDNDCTIDGIRRFGGGQLAEPIEDMDGDRHSAVDAPCVDVGASETTYPADDCDDGDPTVYAGAFEACDGLDNDCDGVPDNVPGLATAGSACLPIQISAGGEHTCVRNRNGTAVCWGGNAMGQLGDLAAPADAAIVVPTLTDVVDVAAGQDFGCAVDEGGTVTCWGNTEIVQALESWQFRAGGFGPIMGIGTAIEVTAGVRHACAIVDDGQVYCWGATCMGVLDGDDRSCGGSILPIQVPGIDDAVQVDAGSNVTCALRATGEIYCWGLNGGGTCGDGTTSLFHRGTVTGIADAIDVAAGESFACALREDGTVWCWGDNSSGQLGCGGAACGASSAVPIQVPGLGDVVDIDAGIGTHVCARLATGPTMCWGGNGSGQIGVGYESPSVPVHTTPVQVEDVGDATSIALGLAHTCALRPAGIECWGAGGSRQLGDGRTTYELYSVFWNIYPAPVSVVANVVGLAGNDSGTCFRLPTLEVRCVGADTWGELGGHGSFDGVPHSAFGITDAIDVALGPDHACVVQGTSGTVQCFGDNRDGRLGDAGAGGPVHDLDGVVQVAAGRYHGCALRSTGEVRCWGGAGLGQLGAGAVALPRCSSSGTCSNEPLSVLGIDDAVQVTAGLDHTCALRAGGDVSCWGNNRLGEVGAAPLVPAFSPRDVVGLPLDDPAVEVAAGGSTTCAVTEAGDLWCWGAELRRGTPGGGGPDPIQVLGVSNAVQIAMTLTSACVRLRSGRVRCLGGNEHGELGNGGTTDSTSPVNVTSLSDARDIGCGDTHCCATRTSGQTVCWGDNSNYRLANPWAANPSRTPVTTVDLLRL